MSGIFTQQASPSPPQTPRSPYKASNGTFPQATDKLLHFDGTPYAVSIKPSRRPSLTNLHPPQQHQPVTTAPAPLCSAGMKSVMQHPVSSSPRVCDSISPRKVGISPGGPTSIILG